MSNLKLPKTELHCLSGHKPESTINNIKFNSIYFIFVYFSKI